MVGARPGGLCRPAARRTLSERADCPLGAARMTTPAVLTDRHEWPSGRNRVPAPASVGARTEWPRRVPVYLPVPAPAEIPPPNMRVPASVGARYTRVRGASVGAARVAVSRPPAVGYIMPSDGASWRTERVPASVGARMPADVGDADVWRTGRTGGILRRAPPPRPPANGASAGGDIAEARTARAVGDPECIVPPASVGLEAILIGMAWKAVTSVMAWIVENWKP